MSDQFELNKRIFAIEANAVNELLQTLLAKYGVKVLDGERIINTLGVFQNTLDRADGYYATDFMRTITPSALTDGRLAFSCYWNAQLAQDFLDEKNGIIKYQTMVIDQEINGTITQVETTVALPPQFTACEEITHEQFLALLPPPMELPIP